MQEEKSYTLILSEELIGCGFCAGFVLAEFGK
jgi:hypothetical protein